MVKPTSRSFSSRCAKCSSANLPTKSSLSSFGSRRPRACLRNRRYPFPGLPDHGGDLRHELQRSHHRRLRHQVGPSMRSEPGDRAKTFPGGSTLSTVTSTAASLRIQTSAAPAERTDQPRHHRHDRFTPPLDAGPVQEEKRRCPCVGLSFVPGLASGCRAHNRLGAGGSSGGGGTFSRHNASRHDPSGPRRPYAVRTSVSQSWASAGVP